MNILILLSCLILATCTSCGKKQHDMAPRSEPESTSVPTRTMPVALEAVHMQEDEDSKNESTPDAITESKELVQSTKPKELVDIAPSVKELATIEKTDAPFIEEKKNDESLVRDPFSAQHSVAEEVVTEEETSAPSTPAASEESIERIPLEAAEIPHYEDLEPNE